MKTIILLLLCLCLSAAIINADKPHKHQSKLLKSSLEEHQKLTDVQTVDKQEVEPQKTLSAAGEVIETKPVGSGRKHRNNHHGKNKKVGNSETHTGRSRKPQTKPNKQNGQRSHNNKNHGRKHGRGKQSQ